MELGTFKAGLELVPEELYTTMEIFLSRFEDPERPLLGPNLWTLTAFGLWQPQRCLKTHIWNGLLASLVVYIASEYVELWFLRSDYEMALRNLSYSLLSTVCMVKHVTFLVWQKYWNEIIDYATNLEKHQRLNKNEKIDVIIDGYTKYCRKVTYCYSALAGTTVVVVMIAPIVSDFTSAETREGIINGTLPYPEIMSSWVPFDKTRGAGYVALSIYQAFGYTWGGGVVSSYDTTIVTLMSFFAGQLRILKIKCELIFGNEMCQTSRTEARRRIIECQSHHCELIRFCKLLNSMLSPVMFLYVIVCSLMICASAVTLTEGTTVMQKIWIAEYLLALIFQLFLFCWHSNEVMFVSHDISYGIFSSLWWCRSSSEQRTTYLLGGQLDKKIVFYAGPFTKLNVATFISILKGAYSFYTLLK